MKTDLYTKAVLTVIAVMLTVIALKPLISPGTVVHGQTDPGSVQFGVGPNGTFYFFEPSKTRLLVYGPDGKQRTPIDLVR